MLGMGKMIMEDFLLRQFNALELEGAPRVIELHQLKGDFINLLCRLPNGKTAKLLDDDKMYYGAELCKKGSERCYGLAADETQLLVYEYGEGGKDAELLVWKKL